MEKEKEGVERGEGEKEEELELGLSLGATSSKFTGGKSTCRILTAKDFPPLGGGGSRASHVPLPSSPPSSSSSAVGSALDGGGSKRAKPGPTSPETGGSSHQPSQMVVGWPPIRTFRMNNLFNLSKDSNNSNSKEEEKKELQDKSRERENEKEREKEKGSIGNDSSTLFVKVKMDGDPIGRKVDLRAHNSYSGLASALELMFQKPNISSHGAKALNLLNESSEFKLTYEDRDGDWMLVGDVPWEMFVDTVRRLRIMRHSDDNARRFQSSNRSIGVVKSKQTERG